MTDFEFSGTNRTNSCGIGGPHAPHVVNTYPTRGFGERQNFCLGREGNDLKIIIHSQRDKDISGNPARARGEYGNPDEEKKKYVAHYMGAAFRSHDSMEAATEYQFKAIAAWNKLGRPIPELPKNIRSQLLIDSTGVERFPTDLTTLEGHPLTLVVLRSPLSDMIYPPTVTVYLEERGE